ncbi:MAG: glycerophosphodiester phosphodiesterase [Cyanobacteria bacterium Co-bin13]|nr:glycerophosphodiester phosphodiesterase [Cyanobacteria bacterium Co-bin13]
MQRRVLVTAHRGSSAIAPENTLAALQQAIVDGADFAEVDVQATADGELVLFHDADLSRIAGLPHRLGERSYREICQVDAGRWFGPEFAAERIPRLAEAVNRVRGQLRLNLELKAYGSTRHSLAQRLVEQLQQLAFSHDCIVTCFDRALLWQVHQLAPQLRLGLICADTPSALENWLTLYSVQAAIATPKLIKSIQSRNQAIHVWTVNDPADMQRFIQWGVDSLITDQPGRLRQVLAAA